MVQTATHWKCNACAREGKTSKEHLIHAAIGRVILRDRHLTKPEVRALLEGDYFRDFGAYEDPIHGEPVSRVQVNGTIQGLICKVCNEQWAATLENDAGESLYDFTFMRRPADAALLRRWAWFFATKLWFHQSRSIGLADGPLRPVLAKLANPGVDVQVPVRVAQLDASDSLWRFAGFKGWSAGPDPYMQFVIRGVLWIVPVSAKAEPALPVRTVELTPGLRRREIPRLRRREYVRTFQARPADFGNAKQIGVSPTISPSGRGAASTGYHEAH